MILLFLANGFEEIEALTPVDVLRRAGFDVKTVAVGQAEKDVVGSHGITVRADLSMSEAKTLCSSPEAVILPGGMPGAKNLDEDADVDKYIRKTEKGGGVLGAICAAPMVLGKRGYLRGKRATCFPGFEDTLDGAIVTGGRVEIDGKTVTACGMGAAVEFALALVNVLKGESAAEEMRRAILAL